MIAVTTFETLDSTSDEVRRRLLDGAELPFAVRARTQTQGRGTKGRQWVSTEGNLALSFAIPMSANWAPSLQAGVVVAEWLETHCGIRVALKWPNDLMVAGRKLGGLLCETVDQGGRSVLIVGIGLNVYSLTGQQAGFAYETTSLEDLGCAEILDLDRDVPELLLLWQKRWHHVSLADYTMWTTSALQPYRVAGNLDVVTGVASDGSLLGRKQPYYSSHGLSWCYQRPTQDPLWVVQVTTWGVSWFCFDDPWGKPHRVSPEDIVPPELGWPLYQVGGDRVEWDGWTVLKLCEQPLEPQKARDMILKLGSERCMPY